MTNNLNKFNTFISKANILLLGLIVFLIPIYHKFLSPLIALWALTNLVIIVRTKQKIRLQKSQLVLIGFYLLLAIGLFWTKNMKAGGFDLEVKLSLLLFPLFFLYIDYSKPYIRFVIYAFILGILSSSFFLLYRSILLFNTNGSIDSFFYINFSTLIHPSYLSLYVVTAILILLVDLRYSVLKLFNYNAIYLIFLFVLFTVNLLLVSKIGIIVCVSLILFFIVQWVLSKSKYVLGGVIFIGLLISLYSFYQFSPYAKQRINETYVSLIDRDTKSNNGSTGIRLKIWKEGVVLIKENPFIGYGTGDVKDVLMNRYKLNGINAAFDKKLNAHNQFIQIGIGLGGIGLFVFSLIFYFGLLNGRENKNYFSIGFLLISIIFMLPESVLENQAGTIFFGLFISLFNQKSFFQNEFTKS